MKGGKPTLPDNPTVWEVQQFLERIADPITRMNQYGTVKARRGLGKKLDTCSRVLADHLIRLERAAVGKDRQPPRKKTPRQATMMTGSIGAGTVRVHPRN